MTDMVDFVTYNATTGELTGGYQQTIPPIPAEPYILVSYEVRNNFTSYRMNAARDGVELIPWTPPVPQVPYEVPMPAFRLQLLAEGSLADFKDEISGDDTLTIYWETLNYVGRDGALAAVLGDMGKTSVEIDDFFMTAGGLSMPISINPPPEVPLEEM